MPVLPSHSFVPEDGLKTIRCLTEIMKPTGPERTMPQRGIAHPLCKGGIATRKLCEGTDNSICVLDERFSVAAIAGAFSPNAAQPLVFAG